ncbi:putative ribonuclease H-like domain-containing protein [Tanacetum coccineum]
MIIRSLSDNVDGNEVKHEIPPPTITAMKIPIIRKGEYDIWSMRMRQYICHTDHNLCDVIVNGDLEEEPAPTGDQSGPSAPPAPKTAKQLATRRNQERVKSILLLTIPNEYLLKFHNVADAKSLCLDKAYDRFQKLISQLEVHGAPISKKDVNQKFLRSLPSSWNQIALIMRNKPDIDEIDIDDLYNNLRVYEDELKRSSASNSASQNLAFLSYENTGGTNEVSTASGDFRVSTAGGINQVPSTLCAHDVAYSFLAQPITSPQLENEDFQQMDGDDLKELDLRWHVAMLTVRVKKSGRNKGRRSYGENGRSNAPTTESSSQALVAQDGLGGYDWSNDFEVEPVNYALMAISSCSSSSSDSERVGGVNHETDSENSLSIFDVRSSDEENTLENDRFLKNGYKVVPPPITGNFLTPRADISFAGLDEYAIRNKIIESQTTELNTKTSEGVGQTNDDEKPKSASIDHLIKDCNFHDKKIQEPKLKNVVNTGQREGKPVWDNTKRINHQNFSKYPHLSKTFVPSGVLTRTCLHRPSVGTARPVCTARPNVSTSRPVCTVRPSVSTVRPICTARPSVGTARPVCTARPSVSAARPVSTARPVYATRPIYLRMDNGQYLRSYYMLCSGGDSGCSSHMMEQSLSFRLLKLSRSFVAFGSDPKGDDPISFNLFFVSQMCDKKNSVLFTESECLILSRSFKLLDDSQVVLRAPRKDDVYNLDLKNIVPSGGTSKRFTFKKVFCEWTKLVLPAKKGKPHKAPVRPMLGRIIRKPLELLHMDLFGPVSVESINKKRYCLVVTDDFRRFSWVLFLATKDETSEILCNFIIGLENQLSHNVKIIRCDNGTEFKNHAMNEFCDKKGIKGSLV